MPSWAAGSRSATPMPSRAAAAASPSRRRTSPAPRRPARTRRTTARVTGLGGVFFRARDLDALADWYRRHLGIPVTEGGYHVLEWRERDAPEEGGSTVWPLPPPATSYLRPPPPPHPTT